MYQPPSGPAVRLAHDRPVPAAAPVGSKRPLAVVGGLALGSLLAAALMQVPAVAQHGRQAVAMFAPSLAKAALPGLVGRAPVAFEAGRADAILAPLRASHVMAVPPLGATGSSTNDGSHAADSTLVPQAAGASAIAPAPQPEPARAMTTDERPTATPTAVRSAAASANPATGSRAAESLPTATDVTPRPALAQPSPELTPRQVVAIQLEALQQVDVPARDAGIAVVFRFASPENRSQTGPLARFSQMVRDGYPEMLNHRSHTLSGAVVQGGEALLPVELTTRGGRVVRYIFILRQQQDGLYKNCWMTDGVVLPDDQPTGLET